MSTVNPTITNGIADDGSVLLASWALTSANADGAPFEFPQFSDRTWHITSAAWGAATLALQGSNDGTNWFTLNNAAGGTALTFTTGASVGAASIELPRYVRPNLTTPGSGATVTVSVLARRANPMRT